MSKRIATTIQLLCITVVFFTTATAAAAQQDTTAVQDTTAARVFTDTTFVDDTTQVQEAHPHAPDRRGFLIVTADGKSSLRIRGSLRVKGDYDLRGLQSAENFNTYEIPVGEANTSDPRFFMNARQTRVGLEVTSDTDYGGLFLRVETDFLGDNNTARLRHAFGSVGRILVGQTWSTFGDLASIPLTVDLDGPNSSVAVRTVQVRYSVETEGGYRLAVAAEAPGPEVGQIDTLGAKLDFQVTPDIVGRARKFGAWGHTQLAGVFRTINVKDASEDLQVLPGFGALLSGHIEFSELNKFMWQIVGGYAISRFITALSGQGLDVVLNPNTGRWETVTSFGGYGSFGHTWKPGLVSHLTIGVVKVTDKGGPRTMHSAVVATHRAMCSGMLWRVRAWVQSSAGASGRTKTGRPGGPAGSPSFSTSTSSDAEPQPAIDSNEDPDRYRGVAWGCPLASRLLSRIDRQNTGSDHPLSGAQYRRQHPAGVERPLLRRASFRRHRCGVDRYRSAGFGTGAKTSAECRVA
jgi:hypothetical protein